jgi:hypothetical protein
MATTEDLTNPQPDSSLPRRGETPHPAPTNGVGFDTHRDQLPLQQGGNGSTAEAPPDAGASTPRLARISVALTRVRLAAGFCSSLITHYSLLVAPIFWALVSLVFLLGCSVLLFRNALEEGQIYYRSDTVTYYFPIAERLIDALREGRVILWTRYLFGGFPLFADGEGGMLYPLNLIVYAFLSGVDAMVWLWIIRYFMAAAFTYAYLRALRINGFAALVGSLAFAFGSFMVGQMAHTNVGNTTVWLPLTLCMIELGLGTVGRKRWLFMMMAGASVGIQSLGLHIQPLIMSGFFLALYVPFRVLLCPIAWPARGQGSGARDQETESRGDRRSGAKDLDSSFMARVGAVLSPERRSWGQHLLLAVRQLGRFLRPVLGLLGRLVVNTFHRGIMTGLLLCLIPAIAFGIAAAQVLPLMELGQYSFRGLVVNYQFATSYSLPVQNLVNLLFPYFFRYTNQQYYWSLWSEWEATLYIGVVPLILATIAVLLVRRRMVLFFAVMAALSLVLAFGGYSPYPLWDQIRTLPGFSSLRVPARFTMLTTFSLAVLAAFGADWLCRTLRPRARQEKSRWVRLSRAVGTGGFALYLMGLAAAVAGVAWWLVSFRIWIEKDQTAVKIAIQQSYLSLRNDRPWLTPDLVVNFLNYSLDPTNTKTATSLALMMATFLLLFAWFAFRRLWRAWASLLVLLVAADMLLFATDFHPTIPASQLADPNPAVQWLISQNRDGLERVYTSLGARRTEANKLLPFQISEITGYSSLETKRHQEYVAKMREYEKPLLDLYSSRFIVMTRNPNALPSYRYVAYHPTRPLADGPSGGRNGQVTFYMSPPVKTDEVCLISSLRDAVEIPQDADVADIVVVDTTGERVTLKVKAGRDTAEWAYDRPDVTPHMRHQRPEVAGSQSFTDSDNRRYQANLYYGELPLDRTRTVERVELHYTNPKGAMRLYGLMLWENPSTAHQVLDRNRYIPRYQDDEVAIMENPAVLPRAYLVPSARVVKPEDMLETMARGDFDPTKTALLELPDRSFPLADEGGADQAQLDRWLQGGQNAQPGKAEITAYRSDEMVVRTASERNTLLFLADSYYPGWKALVDGREEKVYRADYLFRAVPVPAGQHEVRFFFEPDSFDLGRSITLFTLTSFSIVFVGLLLVPPAYRGSRWLVTRARTRQTR